MKNDSLPTDELKKYGIIDSDNSFSKKLSPEDIQKFMNGETIVADNDKHQIAFKLSEGNTRLNVKMFEKDRSFQEILKEVGDNPRSVQYAMETEFSENKDEKNFTRLAFLMKNDMHVYRYDMVKDAKELTQEIAERKDVSLITLYKMELQKLQSFLQDKIDKYPEVAKQITENLNIVSNEINSVNSISAELNKTAKSADTEIRLDVNDMDLYEDVNAEREEEQEQEQQEEFKKRGFRR